MVWLDLGLNLGLPDHWRTTLSSLGHWLGSVELFFMNTFPNPFACAGCDTRSIFSAEFSRFEIWIFLFLYWLLTKVKDPSLLHYLLIAGGRIGEFIPFPAILAQFKMKTASSRIWTRVAGSIFYCDDCPLLLLLIFHVLLVGTLFLFFFPDRGSLWYRWQKLHTLCKYSQPKLHKSSAKEIGYPD